MFFLTVSRDGREQLVKIVKTDTGNEHFLEVCIVHVTIVNRAKITVSMYHANVTM